MSRDINGNYTLPVGNPVVTGTVIASTWANNTASNIAVALTDSLSRSGLGGMTAALKGIDGVVGGPAFSWTNEPTSGWYRKASGEFWFSVGGADVFGITADGIEITPGKTLSGTTRDCQCQLQYVSATSIKLMPWNGNNLQIAGVSHPIPAAGVASANPTAAANYVNRVANQVLAVSTWYYVYVFSNGGTLTLEFENVNGRVADTTVGNIGVQIMNGFPTHTLVGQVRTDSSGQFELTGVSVGVRSWFNDVGVAALARLAVDTVVATAPYGSLSAGTNMRVLGWLGEHMHCTVNCSMVDNIAGTQFYNGVGHNSTSSVGSSIVAISNANVSGYACSGSAQTVVAAIDGPNTINLLCGVVGGSAPTWLGGACGITATSVAAIS